MKNPFEVTVLAAVVAIALLVTGHAGYAQENDFPSSKIKAEFLNTFQQATKITWGKSGLLYYATFSNAGESWIAFVQKDGSLITSGRRIAFNNLPLLVQQNVNTILQKHKKKLGELHSGCIYEMVKSDITEYYIPFENDQYSLIMQSSSNGTVNVVAKKPKHKTSTTEIKRDVMAKK